MQDIGFRYGPMQHRAEKTLTDAGNNLMKTTYYVHDASGNVMAIYEKGFNGGILETRLKACPECNRRELPIYGSDRLGLRLDDTPVKVEALCVYCEAVPNLAPGMLRVSELLYDSPLTPPSSAEVHKGEYVTLRNTSGIPIPLRYVKLRVPSHGSYRPVLSHVEGFSSTDTLQPDHSILVAYGTGTDSTDLRLADNLPAGLFSDPTMHLRTQTSMTLPDAGGSLQLYEDVSGFETLLENISFGGSGILAANAYCDTTCQADTCPEPGRRASRPEVQAVQLIDYTDTYTYGGLPYEAREAKGKGKDGETYYTVKAVTGRKPGSKEYELKDHLGNVRVVISDIKHSVISPAGVVGSFNADVKVMRDYYAFGMEMPGQIWQAGGYRYGFNGMERDDELKGQGASYDFGARMYDPRIGRWLSCDPAQHLYPELTPFVAFGNMPTMMIDPGGETLTFANSNMAAWFDEVYAKTVSEEDRNKIEVLRNSDVVYNIIYEDLHMKGAQAETGYDFENDEMVIRIAPQYLEMNYFHLVPILGDELQHAYQFETSEIAYVLLENNRGFVLVGYDVDDEIESHEGSWRAVQAFIFADNPDYDDNNEGHRRAAYEKYGGKNYAESKKVINPAALQAFLYHKRVHLSREMTPKQFLFDKVVGGYDIRSFANGKTNEGEKTTNIKEILQSGQVEAQSQTGRVERLKIAKYGYHEK